MPIPSASPPWICPSTIIGLIRTAAVVHRNEATNLDVVRLRVDVDDADVGAERIRQIRRVIDHLRVESTLEASGSDSPL